MGIKNGPGNALDNSHIDIFFVYFSREDNPLRSTYRRFYRTDRKSEGKNPMGSRTTLDCERSVTRTTLLMEENCDGDRYINI